jgi:hypothetical protein
MGEFNLYLSLHCVQIPKIASEVNMDMLHVSLIEQLTVNVFSLLLLYLTKWFLLLQSPNLIIFCAGFRGSSHQGKLSLAVRTTCWSTIRDTRPFRSSLRVFTHSPVSGLTYRWLMLRSLTRSILYFLMTLLVTMISAVSNIYFVLW